MVDTFSFAVFAIQKCDPAPFYLFDEVGLFHKWMINPLIRANRLTPTSMHNTVLPLLVSGQFLLFSHT